MPAKGENKNLTYIGTFDGHDGDTASNKCAAHLHLALAHRLAQLDEPLVRETFADDEINHLDKYNLNYEAEQEAAASKTPAAAAGATSTSADQKVVVDQPLLDDLNGAARATQRPANSKEINDAFVYAYKQMDRLLMRGRDETSKLRYSGCTCATCLIEHVPASWPTASAQVSRRSTSTASPGPLESPGADESSQLLSATTPEECWIHMANCGNVEAIMVCNDETLSGEK